MQFPFQGLKVCFRHYPIAPTDILFNGEPIATDTVVAILEDNTLDMYNPISTCLGYVIDQNEDDEGGFNFYSTLKYSYTEHLQFENEFRLLNGATFAHGVSFVFETSASFFLNIVRDNVPAPTSFNFLDLNGNCGTLKNGTIVTVTDKEGEYIVRSSQIFWNDNTKNSNMIIYYLEQDGCFMYSPDCHVTKKKVVLP